MSVGQGPYQQESSVSECRRVVNMKTEPDQKLPAESISIHGSGCVPSDPSLSLTTEGRVTEKDRLPVVGGKDICLSQRVLQKITDDGHAKISKIVNDIQSLNDLEMISLYLSLPAGQPNDVASLGNALGPSNPTVHLSNQLEQSQAYTWILSHLEEDISTCLRKDEVYEDYRSYCDNHSLKCLNTADFGKVMKRAFPNVKPRRLGQRGQSKYCYGGLRKRVEVQPPFLPDLDPLRDDTESKSGAAGRDASSSEQNVPPGEFMLSECIALVLEWVEKLLGRQFVTLRQLAEYLVLNMYVNSRSCAAFALVADVHSRQNQTPAKPEQRRKSVSSRDSEPVPRLPSPRAKSGENDSLEPLRGSRRFSVSQTSGSASSDTSTPPSATPPGPPPSAHFHSYDTPPSAHIHAYDTPPSAHIHAYGTPPTQQYASTPPSAPPAVKPNLLQLPSNIAPHTAHTPHSNTLPMRAFPRYHAPYSDSYRAPPPLQYGGGTYTPQRVGKRPYETTSHEYYSPYYPYPDNNAKRSRYDLGTAPVYGQQPARCHVAPAAQPYSTAAGYPQQQPQSQPQRAPADPYSGMGMLSPRSYSVQQQQSQASAVPSARYSLGPRLGPSPGPSGRSPSPLRFTSGPPTTGVRRPSPLRGSPAPGNSQESPESGSSIHLPPVSLPRSPTSPFRTLPKKAPKSATPGPTARPSSREFDFPDGAPTSSNFHTSSPEEHRVTSTTVASAGDVLCGFAEAARNADLHTPTPPSVAEYIFGDTSAQSAGAQRGSGLTPPSALL